MLKNVSKIMLTFLYRFWPRTLKLRQRLFEGGNAISKSIVTNSCKKAQ